MSNNTWTKWDGGECPVEEGVLVDVRYRDGQEKLGIPALQPVDGYNASHWFWMRDGMCNDIVAYRVAKCAPKADTNGWIAHDGVEMPVKHDTLVDVMLYGETEADIDNHHTHTAGGWAWHWGSMSPEGSDIVKWRIHKEASSEEPVQKAVQLSAVKSDGGSSGYYGITIKNQSGEEFNCETNDVLYAFVGGDWDLSNIIKAARRIYEASQGRGKVGTDIPYDCNKIRYFVDDFERRFGK